MTLRIEFVNVWPLIAVALMVVAPVMWMVLSAIKRNGRTRLELHHGETSLVLDTQRENEPKKNVPLEEPKAKALKKAS